MVDASSPVVRVRAHSISPADSGLPRTLRLDPPTSVQPLWRMALIGLGPLGVLGFIAASVALSQRFGG